MQTARPYRCLSIEDTGASLPVCTQDMLCMPRCPFWPPVLLHSKHCYDVLITHSWVTHGTAVTPRIPKDVCYARPSR